MNYDLAGLGDDDEGTVKVVLGGAEAGAVVQPAPASVDHKLGFALGNTGGDPEWEEYQRWKAWKAQQGGEAMDIAAVAKTNQPIGIRDKARIIVDEAPDMPPTGYPVGLNGVAYIIRPGEPVDVPLGVLEIIKNAVQSVPQIDGKTQRVVGYRDRPRIPWRYA